MFTNLKVPTLAIALAALLSPVNHAGTIADGFGIRFAKETRHGTFAVGYSSGPFWAPGYRAKLRHRRFVPGHYETELRRVFVPGRIEKVWVPAAYAWRRDAWGRLYRTCVSGAHYRNVRQPGHYETREVRVWVESRWCD